MVYWANPAKKQFMDCFQIFLSTIHAIIFYYYYYYYYYYWKIQVLYNTDVMYNAKIIYITDIIYDRSIHIFNINYYIAYITLQIQNTNIRSLHFTTQY